MTKYLALLGAVPMVVWLAAGLFGKNDVKLRQLSLMAAAAVGFCLPIASFELWKIAAIGPSEYLAVWRDTFQLVTQLGISGSGLRDPISHVSAKFASFGQSFGLSPLIVIAALLGGGFALCRSANARSLYAYFAAAALVHWIWWVFVAPPGWPRYLVIGLVYQAAALAALAYAVRPHRSITAAATVVIVVLHYPHPVNVTGKIKESIANRFKASPEITHLREAAELLARLPGNPKFVTANWTTGVGLEYMLPSVSNFIQSDYVSKETRRSTQLYVAVVARWGKIHEFLDWENLCHETIFDKKPIRIAKCPPPPLL